MWRALGRHLWAGLMITGFATHTPPPGGWPPHPAPSLEPGLERHPERRANTGGRRPEPGLVRLRLAQGRLDGAVSTARALRAEGGAGPDRPEILAACVEVAVAAGDLGLADAASAELDTLAATFDQPVPHPSRPRPGAARPRRCRRCGTVPGTGPSWPRRTRERWSGA